MSGKSTPSQLPTLPQGGGALRGIGETFAPDLHTGTGNFTVPIALPPGRSGLTPELALAYSTGAGNGPFGLGWSITVPGVSRKTATGVPTYADDQDTFILSGAEDLVPVAKQPGATRYRPRTEGLFARITHHQAGGDDYWEVHSKDGKVSRYGTPRPADAPAGWRDPAALADPDDPGRIFAWRLSATTDPFGNRVEYAYERDAGQLGPTRRWEQLYLAEIRYADHGTPTDPQFLVTVRLRYQDRPDAFSDHRAGFEIRTTRRCARIEIATHAAAGTLARSYHLTYLDQLPAGADRPPPNGVSLLAEVAVEGHDGGQAERLPPLRLRYSPFEPADRKFTAIAGADLPPASLAHPQLALVDVVGNGLPDILELGERARYWRNRGDGTLELPRELPAAPAGVRLGDRGVELIDANGDGRVDLLVSADGTAGYYPMAVGGLWDRRSFQPYRAAPTFDLHDPEVRLVDLDGDGVTDAVRSGARLECFFNDPETGWGHTRQVERRALERFPSVSFADPRVRLADMTGDGLQDVVLVHDGTVEYWPSRGRGDYGPRVSMHHSPRFPEGYNPARILLGDVDGDGAADLVYVGDRSVTLWVNQAGNGWGPPITVTGTPPVSDLDTVRLADMDGTGIGGVLWSADAGGLTRQTLCFLDFTGGAKPYLLTEVDNNIGALTRMEYAPSTRFYLHDQQHASTRWKTPLPFPVQVLAHVEHFDRLSGGRLTSQFSYHHGYWDGAEREFRGFGRVDQRDSETFADQAGAGLHPEHPAAAVPPKFFSPPAELRTWFHLGPVGDARGDWAELDLSAEFWPGDPQVLSRPAAMTAALAALPRRARRDALRTLRGRILRTELYALDGSDRHARPYTVTESLHGIREEPPADPSLAAERVFFPHQLATRQTQWERGRDPMHRFSFSGDFDEYGQARAQTTIAVQRGRGGRQAAPPGAPYLATHTTTSFARPLDPQRHLVDRPARSVTYELPNDGSSPLFAFHAAIEDGTAPRRVIGATLRFYDGPAFEGLPLGQVGAHGALVRTQELVLTEELLGDGYRSGETVLSPAELPPYLTGADPPPWSSDYPPQFRDLLPAQAGYQFQPGGPGSPYERGFYARTDRRRYDFHDPPGPRPKRGLLTATRSPLGYDTTIAYDAYQLLPVTVTDPAGLTTSAAYDYRLLQPHTLTDPNGNRTTVSFTPLGLIASHAAAGRPGDAVGDLTSPSTRFVYDLGAFAAHGEPISVRTIRRVHHDTDTGIPLPERDQTIETVQFSDGFGRLLQTRSQAEDVTFGDPAFGDAGLPADQTQNADAVGQHLGTVEQPRVAVSGWQVYDNKGRVVEKYEPFFSLGWAYRSPDQERTESGHDVLGQKATLFYDPLGRLIRTVNPDGSQQRVLHGVPGTITAPELSNPDLFEPTPWERYTYDGNDNAGRTHPATSTGYQSHWNTPSSALVDALGRTVQTVQRNGTDPASDWYVTRSSYDLRGNLLTVTDALGRVAFRHVYDLAATPHLLRVQSIDAGVVRTVLDAAGNVIEQRDSKGALLLHGYDAANRPSRLWARDDTGNPVTLRERLDYGDGGDPNQAAGERAASQAANLLGRLSRHYDEAGLLSFDGYDFKGNLVAKSRQVVADAAILSVFDPPPPGWQVPAFRVDWQPPAGTSLEALAGGLLDPTRYQTSLRYDALNRPTSITFPRDVDGQRKTLQLHYNPAGALERVDLDGTVYVDRIAHNAKGQRTLVALGNGVMTRHTYDPITFRLARLRSEPYTKTGPTSYHPSGAAFQDFGYGYDLAGNLLSLHDRTPGGGLPIQPDQLDRTFTYDPIYRLRSATGRECDVPPPSPPWVDTPRCTDVTRTRAYTQDYTYDPVGNLLRLAHSAGVGSFTRQFTLDPDNLAPRTNRLSTLTVGASTSHYGYDAAGNLTAENTSRHFEWDLGFPS